MLNRISLALTLLLAAAALAGPDPRPPASVLPPKPAVPAVVMGEITRVEGTRLEIRPWNPRLPRRLEIHTTSETRCLEQQKGRLEDLAAGDLVLVVHAKDGNEKEPPSTTAADSGAATEKMTDDGSEERADDPETPAPDRPARVKAVLQFWKAQGDQISGADRRAVRALAGASRGYFKGERRGGIDSPYRGAGRVLGVVTRLKPLTVNTGRKTLEFTSGRNVPVIRHRPIRPEALQRGETVLAQSLDAPAPGAAHHAVLVARCPAPIVPYGVQRRLILRERRRRDATSEDGKGTD